jgi:hypothetical protein
MKAGQNVDRIKRAARDAYAEDALLLGAAEGLLDRAHDGATMK